MNSPSKASELVNEKTNGKVSSKPSLDLSSIIEDQDPKPPAERPNSMESLEKPDLSDTKSQVSTRSKNSSPISSNKLRPQDLTFEKFYRTDVSQIFLTVVGHEKQFFSHVNYKIQCIVGAYPPFFIYKRYSEFKALHKAMRIRFENVDWPEMPSKFQILNKVERRREAFDKIIKKVMEVFRVHSSVKKSLLGLLFAFLFDEENRKRLSQDQNKKTSDALNTGSVLSKQDTQGDDESDNEGELERRFLTLDLTLEESDTKSETGRSMQEFDSKLNRKETGKSDVSEKRAMKPKMATTLLKTKNDVLGTGPQVDATTNAKNSFNASRKISAEEDTNTIDNRIVHHQLKKLIEKMSFSDDEIDGKSSQHLSKTAEADKGKKAGKEVSRLKKKEISNFNGEIWVKFQSEEKHKKYYGRINDCFLNLHDSMVDNSIAVMIPCYLIDLKYVKGPIDRVELKHYYDSEALELTLEPENTRDDQKVEYDKILRAWYFQLKIASQKSGNIKGLPMNSILYVKIRHTPFKLMSKKCLFNNLISWDQRFHLPLCDHYFNIYFDIYCLHNDGWIKEHQKEELVCSGSLLVGDLLASHERATLKIKLPLEYSEAKKKNIEKLISTSKTNSEQAGIPEPYIKLKIKNLCSNKTYFGSSPENYIEGVKFDPEVYVKYNLRVALHRLKTLFAKIAIEMEKIDAIVNFKYPLFSLFVALILVWMIIVTDINSIINDLLIFIVLLTIYKYPPVNQWAHKQLDEKVFSLEHRNVDYKVPLVETVDQVQAKKLADMNRFKERIIDPDSLITTLKKIQVMLAQLTIAMMEMANFMEKIKNLICWTDEYRTFYFIVFAVFAYCGLNAFTLRLLILLGTLNAFEKGRFHYKKAYAKNCKIANRTISFIFKRFFPEQVSYLNESTTLWPPTIPFVNLQKKMIEQLRYRLSVELPENALVMYQTMDSLCKAIGTCTTMLKFNIEPGEEIDDEEFKKTPPKISIKTVFNYVWNIPSDYFRLLHPKKNYYSTENAPRSASPNRVA